MEDYEKKILDAIYKDVQAESQLVLEELNSEVEKMHNEQLSIFIKKLRKWNGTLLWKRNKWF